MRAFFTPLFFASVCVSMAGCAGPSPRVKPYGATPSEVQLSETAIFVSADVKNPRHRVDALESTIKAIDGRAIQCAWRHGCPPWARVAAGDHEFVVEVNYNYTYAGNRTTLMPVKVANIKPRHIYLTSYETNGNSLTARVEDLGESPNFKMSSCYAASVEFLEQDRRKCIDFPVVF